MLSLFLAALFFTSALSAGSQCEAPLDSSDPTAAPRSGSGCGCNCNCAKARAHRTRLFNASDAALLLIDHQTGLIQTVHDVPMRDLRMNVKVLAELAVLAKLPLITTASVPQGPNGPLIPEIGEVSSQIYVSRTGEVSAWDKDDFRNAVKTTGRKTLVIAGIWTSVCVAFPAIQAIADGYTVYAVVDASGDPSIMSSNAAQDRMSQAGVVLTTTNALVAEVMRTWRRPDALEYGKLFAQLNINYNTVIESYMGAQDSKGKTLDSEKEIK